MSDCDSEGYGFEPRMAPQIFTMEKMMSTQTAIESGSYIKPGKNFKFPKGLRPFLGTIVNAHERGAFRDMMVQAVLQGNRVPEKKKKQDKNGVLQVAV